VAQLKPYYEALISTIRDNGSQSVILASGNRWAYNLKNIKDDPLSDPNIACTWHLYACHDENNPNRRAATLDGRHRVKSVLVTEGARTRGESPLLGHRADVSGTNSATGFWKAGAYTAPPGAEAKAMDLRRSRATGEPAPSGGTSPTTTCGSTTPTPGGPENPSRRALLRR
jgi:hypothetical protein